MESTVKLVEVGGVCWEVGGVHCQIGGVCQRLVESTVKSVEFIFSLVESAHPNRLPQAPPTSKQTPPITNSDCTNLHQRPKQTPPRSTKQTPPTPPQTAPSSTSDSTNLHQFDTYLSDNCTTYQQVSCAPPSWRIHIFLLHQIGGAFRLLLVPRGVLLGVGRGY